MFSPTAQKYFNNPEFSDLDLVCEGKTYHVHKMLLCIQSTYFAKLCTASFKETNQETITLHGDDPSAFETMLRYMYGFKYDDAMRDEKEDLTFHIKCYLTADKYELLQLKELALKVSKNTVASILTTNKFVSLVDKVYENYVDIKPFPEAIQDVCKVDMALLVKDQAFVDAVKRLNGLAAALLFHVLSQTPTTASTAHSSPPGSSPPRGGFFMRGRGRGMA